MALDSIIKIAGTVPAGATTDGIASIDIPEDSELLCIGGVILGIYEPSPGASANISLRVVGELSFMSTNQIGVNDSRGSIGGIAAGASYLFSEPAETGGAGAKISEFGSICLSEGIILNAGERIYIHGSSSQSGLTAALTFNLYLKTKGGGRRAVKRR